VTPAYHLSQLDAVEWLRTLADESVDLIITDPAYESLEKHRSHGTTTRLKRSKKSSNDWFPIFPNARFAELFAEFYRVLVTNSHCYVMCDQETMFVAKPIGEAAGFRFWKPLIWDKLTIGMGCHYRARYEMILFFEKGKRPLSNRGTPDVLRVPRVRGGYPAEKPEALSRTFIEQSSMPGELVMDPFMGAGSVGSVAIKSGRRFMGADISPVAYAAANLRLQTVAGEGG
jgi:site-specific DNA-methyltransferase (adenine-specific)